MMTGIIEMIHSGDKQCERDAADAVEDNVNIVAVDKSADAVDEDVNIDAVDESTGSSVLIPYVGTLVALRPWNV